MNTIGYYVVIPNTVQLIQLSHIGNIRYIIIIRITIIIINCINNSLLLPVYFGYRKTVAYL